MSADAFAGLQCLGLEAWALIEPIQQWEPLADEHHFASLCQRRRRRVTARWLCRRRCANLSALRQEFCFIIQTRDSQQLPSTSRAVAKQTTQWCGLRLAAGDWPSACCRRQSCDSGLGCSSRALRLREYGRVFLRQTCSDEFDFTGHPNAYIKSCHVNVR